MPDSDKGNPKSAPTEVPEDNVITEEELNIIKGPITSDEESRDVSKKLRLAGYRGVPYAKYVDAKFQDAPSQREDDQAATPSMCGAYPVKEAEEKLPAYGELDYVAAFPLDAAEPFYEALKKAHDLKPLYESNYINDGQLPASFGEIDNMAEDEAQ